RLLLRRGALMSGRRVARFFVSLVRGARVRGALSPAALGRSISRCDLEGRSSECEGGNKAKRRDHQSIHCSRPLMVEEVSFAVEHARVVPETYFGSIGWTPSNWIALAYSLRPCACLPLAHNLFAFTPMAAAVAEDLEPACSFTSSDS